MLDFNFQVLPAVAAAVVVARPLSYLTSQAALQQMAVTTPSAGKAGKVGEGASGKTVEITT